MLIPRFYNHLDLASLFRYSHTKHIHSNSSYPQLTPFSAAMDAQDPKSESGPITHYGSSWKPQLTLMSELMAQTMSAGRFYRSSTSPWFN
jgi:hypothetical protein